MNIHEIILRKRFLDEKLSLIDKYIESLGSLTIDKKSDLYVKAISTKFDLLSKIRSHTILIDKLNRETLLNIDGTELSVYEALHLMDTIESKIDTFKLVITQDVSKSLDVFTLLNKIDILFDEYVSLQLTVLNSDISTDWE